MTWFDYRIWRPVAAACVLLVASACSTSQPRSDREPQTELAVSPAPATQTEAVEPVPVEVNEPASPWQRLRKRFAMLDCDDNPAVLKEARRYTRHPHRFSANWSKAMPLFLLVLEQIERHDLPGEFALLPYVESHYRQLHAKGRGPAGMWQLAGRTALDQGLKVSRTHDERLDALASTRVALRLLERYDRQFSDWRVADMAFNAGEYRVKRTLGTRQAHEFDREELAKLKLSPTTHQHLTRLMALSCIIDDPQRFSVSLPAVEPGVALERLSMPSAIDLRLAAALAELPLDELLRFNAAWMGQPEPHGPASHLLLPQRNIERFNAALAKFPGAMLSDWHTQPIDVSTTLDAIAADLETSPLLLASANHLDPQLTLRPGQNLLLPGRSRDSDNDASAQTHTIRRGDTLSTIARRYGVRLADLLRWNALTTNSILRPGISLRIHAPTY